ncbi:ATP-binding protein [Blastococcus sp. TF02A-30]|uniref:ATP-binding protein n=1 Tax=Blastococcus sp. TF02A-30 TaxID=2250580 RepID=UPI000DEAA6E6|nr:ATP-binding protein [Blastococcus sp. TF02A-30]RBY91079.1 ATP-binding protein [Blastococcus sp. TF02A-30]
MKIAFSVRLPPDAGSVPLMRGLLRQTLEHLRVPTPTIEELALALTEACANVVNHAGEHEEYQVDIHVDDKLCSISVLDDGQGFDLQSAEDDPAPMHDGGGRGLVLMRALVDRLQFVQSDDGRHRVTLEKQLDPGPTPPKLRLLDPR